MFNRNLVLISHHLCPYVQRSLITLSEKNIPHERVYIDLSKKPDWFLALSPTGKVPLLKVDERDVLFESAVICEFLDEVTPGSLHPADPLEKGLHRAWIEYGSQLLNDIGKLYNASTAPEFEACCQLLRSKFLRLEAHIKGPFFAGARFSMVDAAYGPIFRYFDVLDEYLPINLLEDCPRLDLWRGQLSRRESVVKAVIPGYPARLKEFLSGRGSYLSSLMAAKASMPRNVASV